MYFKLMRCLLWNHVGKRPAPYYQLSGRSMHLHGWTWIAAVKNHWASIRFIVFCQSREKLCPSWLFTVGGVVVTSHLFSTCLCVCAQSVILFNMQAVDWLFSFTVIMSYHTIELLLTPLWHFLPAQMRTWNLHLKRCRNRAYAAGDAQDASCK
jgi:hypothetical protein